MVRRTTNELIEMAEGGILSWQSIAIAALMYMSESEVEDMANMNSFLPEEEDEDEE